LTVETDSEVADGGSAGRGSTMGRFTICRLSTGPGTGGRPRSALVWEAAPDGPLPAERLEVMGVSVVPDSVLELATGVSGLMAWMDPSSDESDFDVVLSVVAGVRSLCWTAKS
jgi:hypothetical protein